MSMPRFLVPFLLALWALPARAVLTVSSSVTHETCTYANGAIDIGVGGGVPPYTYAWADGPTVADRWSLSAGSYSLTVTDANLDQVVENVTVLSVGYDIQVIGAYPFCNAGAALWTDDQAPPGAVGPWYVDGAQLQVAPGSGGTSYVFYPSVPPSSSYSYSFADGNGCTGTIGGYIGDQISNWPTLSVVSVEPSCTTEDIGAIHLQSSGPQPAMGFTWIHLLDQNAQPMMQTATVDAALEAHFTDLPPGTYGFHWWLGSTLENLDPGLCVYDTMWVTIPSLGPTCGHVTGTSWYDADADCVRDANEVGIPYSPLEIQPGGDVVLTDHQGDYYIPLLNGSYTLAQQDPTLVPICPATQPVPFTVNTNSTTIDLANGSTEPLDLRAMVSSGTPRPGFTVNIHASASNLSPQLSGPVTFTLDIDPALVINTVNPSPTSTVGNTLSWNLSAFGSFGSQAFNLNAQVPVGVPLGTVLTLTATVSNTLTDGNPGNDVCARQVTVTGSFDPNDKTVRTSTGWSDTQYIIGDDEWLEYVIRFQNTGTDTAFTVAITDTLEADLDMGTFEQGVASHGFSVQFLPGRIVRWTFANILLPDSNTNEPLSHGLVSFRIRPVQPLLPGTMISNNADIFFDFNTPVRTNDAVVVAEMSTQVQVQDQGQGVRVFPNPVSDALRFTSFGISGPYLVELIGVDGRVIRSERTSVNHVDVSMLLPGMYALRVNGSTVRFVKN
ncbi:MAG: T9SS type A sorting domain-containing protein [Flavobacteriales bacterium]|nr:T9SS type A sorting domain-containing protein [Flavobacteriales bacterium]